MTNSTPFSSIAPPPELIAKWASSMCGYYQAARWGANQELEACCEWIHDWYGNGSWEVVENLRAARRPRPSSLKEQATMALSGLISGLIEYTEDQSVNAATIRRALEALDD